jgi:hypothetical protein
MFRSVASSSLLAFAAALSAQALPEPGLVGALTFEQANARMQRPRLLSLKFAEFETTGALPSIPTDLLGLPADGPDYYIVQVRGPVSPVERAALEAHGLELFDYVPNHAFIVRGTAAQVRAAESAGAALWSSALHPAWRIEPELLDRTGPQAIAVVGFTGIDETTLRRQVEAIGITVRESHEQVGRWLLLVTTDEQGIRALARCHDVQWVEPESIVETRNDTMTWTVQTGSTNNRKIWNLGLHGENQIIGHMDSRVSQTSCYFTDPANPIGPTHRKIVYVSGTAGSPGSHGTHTAGTAVGDAFPISGSTANRGLAYAAKLATSSNYSASAWTARALEHRSVGARTHTNSWGNDSTTAYNSHCNAIDAFSWTYEDHLVLFAETNTSTLKNPENAKNLVAVGNAQNGASVNNKCGGGVGPTADGRRKPDLFAPGCSIVSAGTGSCSTSTSTGTSMACPAATAASALIQQYFRDGFYPSGLANPADSFAPSGALTKAVLVNTCQDMTGVAGYPNFTEGWGRINLDESLHFVGDVGRLWVADVRRANGLTTGQSRSFTVDVTTSARPLEVTMVFTDFAGTINATNPVVNNLDLVVTAPNGTTYLGNVWAGGWSSTGGVADAINNVERVAIAFPAPGTWTFTVNAPAVPSGPSGYALCATGDIANGFAFASVEVYGAGKPGAAGVPIITSNLPVLPSNWLLRIYNSVPNQFGIFVYGETDSALPFDGGTVLANPLILLIAMTDGIGYTDFPVALPPDPSLNGSSTYWQFWMPNDPGAAGMGWSSSRGLRMTMGN